MCLTFSAHTPEEVTSFIRGIRDNLVTQKAACVQHDCVLTPSVVIVQLLCKRWRCCFLFFFFFDNSKMIVGVNTGNPLSWISKSPLWLSNCLERQLYEVFRSMDSNLFPKHLYLFLVLPSFWDTEHMFIVGILLDLC